MPGIRQELGFSPSSPQVRVNHRKRCGRFRVEGTADYATPAMRLVLREERRRSVSATGATPYSNPAKLLAAVARLEFCERNPPIWASFRRKIIKDATPFRVFCNTKIWRNSINFGRGKVVQTWYQVVRHYAYVALDLCPSDEIF